VHPGRPDATQSRTTISDLLIRPLEERDVEAADRIMRLAFGTFLGAADPLTVFRDVQLVRPRFAAAPGWAFAAELDGEVVGSNLAARWGSYGFFGPLSVHPDHWNRGVASRLLEPVVALFAEWGVGLAGLFTFPHSPRHIGLYQKFGFWPQYLTPVLAKVVAPAPGELRAATYAGAPGAGRPALLDACRRVTDAIFDGLDVAHEIQAAHELGVGDTVILEEGAFAVCHLGAGEAGSGTCFVKFAAARPGAGAGDRFERLLDACEALAAQRRLGRVVAGVNTARHDAYRRLLARGYRPWVEGVIMQRPNEPGYCRPDVYVLDDLR